MSELSSFQVTRSENALIENILVKSRLNFIPWKQALPALQDVEGEFESIIDRHNLRNTNLGQFLVDFGARKTETGWVTISNLPKTIQPHVLLGLCSYLIGKIHEIPGVGPYISQVKEEAGAQTNRPSHANNLSFALHTDRSYLKEERPEFQFLQSVYNPPGHGGLSEVADIRDALAVLAPASAHETISHLCEENFLFPAPPHSNPEGGDMMRGAVLEPISGKQGQYYIRFRQDGLEFVTDEARHAAGQLVNALEKVKKQFLLQKGDILITDNWRTLHGRTAILSNPERPRELNKAYVGTELTFKS